MKIVEVRIGHFKPNLGKIKVSLTFTQLLLKILGKFYVQSTPLIQLKPLICFDLEIILKW